MTALVGTETATVAHERRAWQTHPPRSCGLPTGKSYWKAANTDKSFLKLASKRSSSFYPFVVPSRVTSVSLTSPFMKLHRYPKAMYPLGEWHMWTSTDHWWDVYAKVTPFTE